METAGRVEGLNGRYRQIIIWPDQRLVQHCAPIIEVDAEVRALLDDLAVTMLRSNGAGLAAPQIGVLRRVVTLKVHKAAPPGAQPPTVPEEEVIYLVNPEVTFTGGGVEEGSEGCLSLPGIHVPVTRPKCVRVRALGYDGQPLEVGGDGLLAVALLHEIEHLDGIMVTDHLSSLKRDLLRRRFTKMKARGFSYKTAEQLAKEAQ